MVVASSTFARKDQWKEPVLTRGETQDCHWTRVGTMSRRMVPWRVKRRGGGEGEEKSTARR